MSLPLDAFELDSQINLVSIMPLPDIPVKLSTHLEVLGLVGVRIVEPLLLPFTATVVKVRPSGRKGSFALHERYEPHEPHALPLLCGI